jgi:hypothetical protein
MLPPKPGAGLVVNWPLPPKPGIPGLGAGRVETPGPPGRLKPPSEGPEFPGSVEGRFEGPTFPGSVDGRVAGPAFPGSGAGRVEGPTFPGSVEGRFVDGIELGSLTFGRVDGLEPPRLPGNGLAAGVEGRVLKPPEPALIPPGLIPPGAGRVVGIPPPRLGRLELMLLPIPDPEFGRWILPGIGRDMLEPMFPLGRPILPGIDDGPAGRDCGIELPNEGLLVGICGAGRDIGIEGRPPPPMLGRAPPPMLGRAPPPMLGRAPPPRPPPPPRICADAESIGPTKPIAPIAKAAGYNQRIIHPLRFI